VCYELINAGVRCTGGFPRFDAFVMTSSARSADILHSVISTFRNVSAEDMADDESLGNAARAASAWGNVGARASPPGRHQPTAGCEPVWATTVTSQRG
jgi:hypothetical protein